MCVAIYKPKGINIPSKEKLYNCYLRNQDGAGFAYCRDGKIHIKKGYMNFDDFYNDFIKENFSKNENIFIHFRIATHGLVDGGNTHPFPVTDSFDTMRKTDIVYNGKCLIHNGVFHYGQNVISSYSKIISDTMLFSKFLFENIKKYSDFSKKEIKELKLEESVARGVVEHAENIELINKINNELSYSKIAIMNEDGSVKYYGNWIEHEGVMYSNSSFNGYNYSSYNTNKIGFNTNFYHNPNYSYRNNNFYSDLWGNKKHKKEKKLICDYCSCYTDKLINVMGDKVCRDCIEEYNLCYCVHCHEWYDKTQMSEKYTCEYCKQQINENSTNICICCGNNYSKEKESPEDKVCLSCYKEYIRIV